MINITELKKRLLSEAQELSPKQKKIAGAAEPKDKITGADFAALRAKKDVKKEEFGIGAMLKNAMRLLEPEELEAFYNALKDEPVIDKAEYRPDFVDGLKKIIMSKDSDSESAKAAKAILNLPNPGHRYGPDKIDQIFDYIKNKKGDAIQEGGDHEVSMAHNSLESIIKSAMELKAKLGGDERNIPGWIQDHITNAENYIDQAAQGFHELSPEDQGEADYDELPDGTEEEPVDDMHNMSLSGLMESLMEATGWKSKDLHDNYNSKKIDEDLSIISWITILIASLLANPISGPMIIDLFKYLFQDLPEQRRKAKELRTYNEPDKRKKVLALAKEIESKLSTGKKKYLKGLINIIGKAKLEDEAKAYQDLDSYAQMYKRQLDAASNNKGGLKENLNVDIEAALKRLPIPSKEAGDEALIEDEANKKPSAGLTKKQKSAISKKAKAGKDIGKKGKGFEKIAKAAAEKYGSKERGQKVAAAAMWKSAAKKAK